MKHVGSKQSFNSYIISITEEYVHPFFYEYLQGCFLASFDVFMRNGPHVITVVSLGKLFLDMHLDKRVHRVLVSCASFFLGLSKNGNFNVSVGLVVVAFSLFAPRCWFINRRSLDFKYLKKKLPINFI